jgi:Gene product 88
MRNVRPLLAMGNVKLGGSIAHFDLPPIVTCPGRSSVCEQVCYATSGQFQYPVVQERLQWCHRQSRRQDFVPRMAQEIRRKGILVVRIHVAGDFYNAVYAARWLEVMRQCPQTKFYFYTRSWRVPEIATVLEQMAALPCCRPWYSIDRETGVPERVPLGVRLAYLQVTEGEQPELVDLMFRVRKLRRQRLPLSLVCPHETEQGRAADTNCGNCGRCWH